ncbi:orotate phosphoribosyltransferase [Candidatus Micrarchaeota archaeon]|nr:orotate phosphoribosyltransferase [Candidatus Micrarchaeota archaeon]
MNTSFIEFLARNEAIRFGEFTLKSGRESPYFIDMGVLTTGTTISELGKYYAAKIRDHFNEDFDVIFGPAYKAVPIAVSAAMQFGNKRWLFDRKEKKLHGADANSTFVGSQNLDLGSRVVIVDDVITTGGTKIEAIEKLSTIIKADILGIVIAVDRMEIGKKNSAIEEFSELSGINVFAIENIDNIFNYLKDNKVDGKSYVNNKTFERYQKYIKTYGSF